MGPKKATTGRKDATLNMSGVLRRSARVKRPETTSTTSSTRHALKRKPVAVFKDNTDSAADEGMHKGIRQKRTKHKPQQPTNRVNAKEIMSQSLTKGNTNKDKQSREGNTKGKTKPTTSSATKRNANGQKSVKSHKKCFCEQINTFTTEGSDQDDTRFCDIVFLDDNHILALDSKKWKPYIEPGFRACCFSLDGRLMSEVPLPGRPVSVVVLSPTDAVITLATSDTKGFVWVSIELDRNSMECTKIVSMEQDAYGIAYDKDADIFVVGHFQENFMTILNRDGAKIGTIPVCKGLYIRCMFLGKDVLFLAHTQNVINAIDFEGEKSLIFSTRALDRPIDIGQDSKGYFYVANAGKSSDVCQFDSNGNFIKIVLNLPSICAMDLNKRSDLMVVAHERFITIYKLQS